MTKLLDLNVDKLSFLPPSQTSKDLSVVLQGWKQPRVQRGRALLQVETSDYLFYGQRCETDGTAGRDFYHGAEGSWAFRNIFSCGNECEL